MNRKFFFDKKVIIMGLGKFGGGLDAAIFASNAGAKVTVTDIAPKDKLQESLDKLKDFGNISYTLGEHIEDDFVNADVVIVNPAVPPNNKFVTLAEQNGALITSQIEIFFQLCAGQIVGITGANGKSTTTSLTHHILSAGKNKAWLGGNIGNQPMLSIVEQIKPEDIVVLEISSFQCEQLERNRIAPDISLITNITPNHLDRHGTFEEYCRAKKVIFAYQQWPCISIFNAEDEKTSSWYEKYQKQEGRHCYEYSADDVSDELKEQFKLVGRMNLSNLAGALCIAKQCGISDEQIAEAVSTFKALPDRLELVANINGVKWYNDSISTTPTSTVAALEAFDEPAIIIAGGYDKQLPFDEMGKTIADKAKAAILIGTTADKIAQCINDAGSCKIVRAETMAQAVTECAKLATAGDVILMSPACASYDMFDNYKQRGQSFKDSVQQLTNIT